MKYTDCPQCSNKIIDRTPLKCVYCGYDSTKDDVHQKKLELLDPPPRPNRDNTTIIQAITILVCLGCAIAFLISLLYSKGTMVNNEFVENTSNLTTIRIVFGIGAILSGAVFFSTSQNFEKEMFDYTNEIRIIYDINQKILDGAIFEDFDEREQDYIIKYQSTKQSNMLNQNVSKYIYHK